MTTTPTQKYTQEQYLAWRKEVLSRMHTIFQHVQQHPQFVCDQPGRRVLSVDVRMKQPSPDYPESRKVLLIQRMNENMELVQEIDIGNQDGGESLRIGLGNGQIEAIGRDQLTHDVTTSLVVLHHLRQTDFFDALEQAVQNPEIATTFEPLSSF